MSNFKPIVDLLQKAGKSLKHPKVRLQLEDGSPLHLSLAGPNSRYRDCVMVTDGAGFGSNKWYGYIDQHGVYSKSKIVDTSEYHKITKLLHAFCANPAETAKVYGKCTGACCFCGLTLTDERSVTAGYGPICAENYGLPWGEVVPEICEIVEEFTMEKPQTEEDKLLAQLQAPPTLEDAIKQIAELRRLCWRLQKQVDNLYHRNH